jgi:hypothetical protein
MESLEAKLPHLKRTFRKNGYSELDVNLSSAPKMNKSRQRKTLRNSHFPYKHATCSKISKLLGEHRDEENCQHS